MYSPVKLTARYLHYYLTAQNGKGHGIHSPFVFDFIINVLNDKRHFYAYTQIEHLRKQLLKDKSVLEIEDMGAGSALSASKKRSVSSIAKHAAKPAKFGQLLFRMVDYYKPASVLELGTSLGITTCYFSSANSRIPVITLEGASAVATEALANFEYMGLRNIRLIEGNFDNTLPRMLGILEAVDLVFIDGNHRREPTLNYFHLLEKKVHAGSMIIFDDIHWSKEMEEAWEEIKRYPSVTLTIDLFFIGIVFFKPEIKEAQHFVIRF